MDFFGGFSYRMAIRKASFRLKEARRIMSSHLLSFRNGILPGGISTVPYKAYITPHFTMVLRSVAAASSGQIPPPTLDKSSNRDIKLVNKVWLLEK